MPKEASVKRLPFFFFFWAIACMAPGCGDTKDCVILQKIFCQDGNLFERTNCGDPGTLKESCPCGCNEDNSACKENCADCTTHDHKKCESGAVYWYDSCDTREDLVQNCGCGCNPEATDCIIPCTTDCDPACHSTQDCTKGNCVCKSTYPISCTSRLCCAATENCRTDKCCLKHSSFKCDGGSVYWFDSCSTKEDQKEPCSCGCTTNACDNCSADDNMSFVSDVTIPDDTQMQPGQTFTKTWRVKNSGTSTWSSGAGYKLVFVSGEKMGAPSEVAFSGSDVAPNSTYDWSVSMIAPSAAGAYRGDWKMYKNTTAFGTTLWVKIVVEAGGCNPPCTATQDCVDNQCCDHQFQTCTTAGVNAECCTGECCLCNKASCENVKICKSTTETCSMTCSINCN